MNKELLQNTFYLIAEYHLEKFDFFISIGDNKEEIIQEFKKRYEKKDLGEYSYQLLEVNAKEIMNSKEIGNE